MTHEDVAAWESFAVAMAGAAAVLAGLVFVAVSVNLDRLLAVPGLPGRAGDSVIMFVTALVECAFVLVPRQPVAALGVELLLTGVLASGVLLTLVIPGVRMPSRQPLSWRAFRLTTTQIVTIRPSSPERLCSDGPRAGSSEGCQPGHSLTVTRFRHAPLWTKVLERAELRLG